MNSKNSFHWLLALTTASALTACLPEDDTDKDPDTNLSTENDFVEITVDASSYTDWVYLDATTQSTVDKDDNWQLALKRYDVLVNDDAVVALVADQAEFYSDDDPVTNTFINATADGELEHFIADFSVADATFSTPSTSYILEAGGEAFYDYEFATHRLYANDDAVWVIRSNTGDAYAKLRPTMLFDDEADEGEGAYETATFELFIQGADESEFSDSATTWSIELTNAAGDECFDIDASAEVDCSNDAWDLHFEFNPSAYLFRMTVNGGVSGTGSAAAVYTGHYDVADTAELISGIQNRDNDDFDITAYHYASDSQSSVISENPWYAYNLNGQHGIWPNYRVYAVQKDDVTYLVQLISYYNDLSQSGHVTLRVRTVE